MASVVSAVASRRASSRRASSRRDVADDPSIDAFRARVRAGERPPFLDVTNHVFAERARARVKLSWEWHAWRLCLMVTPAVVAYACACEVERRYAPQYAALMREKELRAMAKATKRTGRGEEELRAAEDERRALERRVEALERRANEGATSKDAKAISDDAKGGDTKPAESSASASAEASGETKK